MVPTLPHIALLLLLLVVVGPLIGYLGFGCFFMFNISDHHAKNRLPMALFFISAVFCLLVAALLMLGSIGMLGHMFFSSL